VAVSREHSYDARRLASVDELLHSLMNIRKPGRIHAGRFGIGLVQGTAASCCESKQGNTEEK
jgi:hypothetical protein